MTFYLLIIIALVVAFVLLSRLSARLERLERSIETLWAHIQSQKVATRIDQPSSAEEPLVAAEPETSASVLKSEETDDAFAGPWRIMADPIERETTTDPVSEPPLTRQADLETALGTRWAVWVGGLALALGGIFLVRYSLESGFFGPAVRLTFATLFGCALAAAGELARRTGFRSPIAGVDGAYIPAILTAASAFTLFGAVYAAHAQYGFVGPAAAFTLLGAIAVATVMVALVHGQALAGIGLVGSYLTPMLVASNAPNPWALFVYLAIVLAATAGVASIRRWKALAAAAYIGAGLWSVAYLMLTPVAVAEPVAFLHLVGLAMIAVVWLPRTTDGDSGKLDLPTAVAGVMTAVVTTVLVRDLHEQASARLLAAILLAAMIAAATWKPRAIALLHAAGAAVGVIVLRDFVDGCYQWGLGDGTVTFEGTWRNNAGLAFLPHAAATAALVLGAGVYMARRLAAGSTAQAAPWAFWASLLPPLTVTAAWIQVGNPVIDWRFAAASFAIAGILAVSAELVARAEAPTHKGGLAPSFLAAGAAASLCIALHAGFGSVLTTIVGGLAAALPAAITRLRPWPVLGWISAGFAAVTLIRVAIDPTIAGPDSLSTTPVLNALTPGYLLPSAAFAYAAWQLARTINGRTRLVMEAAAALLALLGVAMLVRHAMNDGVIDAGKASLGEQAIYTLIMIGGGAIMLAIDSRSPNPVRRWGSMALGVLSMLSIVSSHLLVLNPLFTNDWTGSIPVFNLVLLAYLIPAIGMAALAWRARGIRPQWYVSMLAIGASLLAFAYVVLSVRRVFNGEFIGIIKRMGELEAYTHSAVWLMLGVALLIAGLRFDSRTLRLASGALVVLAVAKVFLYDMRQLEGVLRALSFIGLGGVLIGIGLFYQRMLGKSAKVAAT